MISMKKKKLETSNKNYLKINLLFLALIISNIIFFIGLIKYHATIGINIDLETIQDIASAIATICILGYVSGRLTKIKGLGESAVFGIMYSLNSIQKKEKKEVVLILMLKLMLQCILVHI